MGLRVRTNATAYSILRNLRISDRFQSQVLERLSSLKRINSAADDPAGLVVADKLRSEIRGLGAAQLNAQTANNMLGTAEAALEQIADLIIDIQEAVTTVQGDSSQAATQQEVVDDAIDAINSLANTTRFATSFLLNGTSDLYATASPSGRINDLRVRRADLGSSSSKSYTVNVAAAAQQPTLPSATETGGSTLDISITGPRGSASITIAAGANNASVAASINGVRGSTGVYYDTANNAIYGEEFGSSRSIRLQKTGGTGTLTFSAGAALASTGDTREDSGTNATVTVGSFTARADGNAVSIANGLFSARFNLVEGVTGSTTITVQESGLRFQIGAGTSNADRLRLGIQGAHATFLGNTAYSIATSSDDPDNTVFGGFLSSLGTGGSNDLFTNTSNAARIAGAALGEVSSLRAFIGGVQSRILQPMMDAMSGQAVELTEAESAIRDADIAEETANLTRAQILYQAGIAALAQANVAPDIALNLLPYPNQRTAARG